MLGNPVSFTAELSLDRCDLSPQTVTIFPIGLNENLTLTVEPACDCDCSPSDTGPSPQCGYHG